MANPSHFMNWNWKLVPMEKPCGVGNSVKLLILQCLGFFSCILYMWDWYPFSLHNTSFPSCYKTKLPSHWIQHKRNLVPSKRRNVKCKATDIAPYLEMVEYYVWGNRALTFFNWDFILCAAYRRKWYFSILLYLYYSVPRLRLGSHGAKRCAWNDNSCTKACSV